jgi:CBS domain-containing protein
MTLVKEVMTRPVITLNKNNTLCEATTLMAQNDVSGAPVVDEDGELIGILSESDILEYAASKEGMGLKLRTLSIFGQSYDRTFLDEEVCRKYRRVGEAKVDDAMNDEVVTIDVEEPIEKALETMVRLKFNRLPVVSKGKLVGMITRQDVLVTLCRQLGDKSSPVCAEVVR